MKSQNAQRKWEAQPSANDVDWLIQENETTILITLEDGKSYEYQDIEKAEKTAKLAAAAPELLDALELANDVLKMISEHHGAIYEGSLTAIQIQSAIKKATE